MIRFVGVYRPLLRPCFNFQRLQSTSTSPLDRYKEKLEQRAKQVGAQSVEELQEKLKDEITQKKKDLNKIDPLKELEEYERRQAEEIARNSNTINVRSPIAKDTPKLPYKTMASYVDVDKIRQLPEKEIEFLWRARFQNKERNIHAVLNNLQFSQMYAAAFKNPNFILPLPRASAETEDGQPGHEMHFVQWSFVGPHTTHCMLTTVAEYKLHKEFAKPHTTLTFHQDLSDTHDVVLMNGQIEQEASLTMDEATLLVLNVQRFYGGVGDPEGAKRKAEILKNFTSGSPDFDIQKLIAEASSMD